MILAIMHSYVHEQAMMDITPNSSSEIIAGDKCILFLVLVVTVNLLQVPLQLKQHSPNAGIFDFHQ